MDRITDLLNEFVKTIDDELVVEVGSDFAYYPARNVITYTLVVSEYGEESFLESVEFFQPKVKCDVFLWSILHEIGHHETIDELTESEQLDSDFIKLFVENGAVSKELYYTCPDERAATGWAVQYAESHITSLAKFWTQLQTAIMDFYKANEII